MKSTLLLVFWLGMLQTGIGQYSKIIVQFTDKQQTPFTTNNPQAYLSQKAIDRRTKQNIVIDSTDFPVNPGYIQQVLQQGAVNYLSQSKWLNQILIQSSDAQAIAAISALPFVKSAAPVALQPNRNTERLFNRTIEKISPLPLLPVVNGANETEDLQYGASAAQVSIHNGGFLHNKGFTGQGITIALLDAGFYHYQTLSAFDSIRNNGQVLGVKDFVDFDNSVDEDDTHGMYCLSTIAANKPGVMVGTAPHASFWLLRSENNFSEYPIEEHNWVAAAEFADSAGADMISSSLGYYWFEDAQFNHSYADFYQNSTTVSKGAAMAAHKGMIVTNSAGNEGNNSWKYLIFPADADSVCSVGAVNTSGVIASFSSYGYTGKVKPNIVSVGSGTTIFGVNDLPATGSGTSFSNPNINGLIACLWQAFPAMNNMAILDAVYKSADKYTNPDNRYGYGLPDMKKAYTILKEQKNIALYGTDWLFATPNPFSSRINIKFIARKEGSVTISLLDAGGNAVRSFVMSAEEQEIYDTAFTDVASLPGGDYFVQYSDGVNTKKLAISKVGITLKDWLVAVPVPFTTQLTVYIKAPETGSIQLRITDAAGKIIETATLQVQQDAQYSYMVRNAGVLPHGVYLVQYVGKQKRAIKVVK